MKTLIVSAHPDTGSLTAYATAQLREALSSVDIDVEIADLASEGFDPRFTAADRDRYRGGDTVPADVAREQARIDKADHLVLVFPVYWWSMPALLKGWIDRVFISGWAFDIDPVHGTRRNLDRLTVHLLMMAGDTAGTYERHAYEQSLRTQIRHGIIDYCGAQRGAVAFVHESEREESDGIAADVAEAVERMVRGIRD